MQSDNDMKMEGEPGAKPYKLYRVDNEGNEIASVGAFATEAEARAFKRRPDWHYQLYYHRQKI